MTQAKVRAGICGMKVVIQVMKGSQRRVNIRTESTCVKVYQMGKALGKIDLLDALKPYNESLIYRHAYEHHLCPSCPVPAAFIKAIEIESGIALPCEVVIHLETVQ